MTATDRISGLVSSVAIKAPCRLATTANITLNGLQSIDGMTTVSGDRVLVKSQTTTSDNGIYVADTGDWVRDVDFDGTGDFVQGTMVGVVSGTLYNGTVWQLTTASPAIGSALAFSILGTGALSGVSTYIQTLLPALTAAAARTTLGTYSTAEVDAFVATLIAKSLVTTKGDLIAASASSTPARLAAGSNGTVPMAFSGATAGLKYASPFGGLINGLTYQNGTDATNDLDIAAGGCMDSTGAYWIQLAAITKQLDAAWAVGTNAGGLDTGTIGDHDYYIWAIARSDTGVTDALYSLSNTAPTMPASYDYKRLIGWFKRASSANVAFKTYETAGGGLSMEWAVPRLDINLATTLTTSRRTDALSVPLNFSTVAHINYSIDHGATVFMAWLYNPDETDSAPSQTAAPLANINYASSGTNVGALRIRTDATGKIAARASAASITAYRVATVGFDWSRR